MPVIIAGCAAGPPAEPDNACRIFMQHRAWYRDAQAAYENWRLPVAMGLAFIHRESNYERDAKPARGRLLWVIPWMRPSSAYGYAQATDEAWADYRRATRSWFAERDDFGNALDFIGWYNHRSHRVLGIAKDDAYHLYLAYHEGPTGYRRGFWRQKANVLGYASKVDDRYQRYRAQLERCRERLEDDGWWFG